MLNAILAGTYNSEQFYDIETTPERRVYQYEIEILLHGEGASFINGVRYPHVPNTLLFAKPRDVRFTTGRFACKFFKFKTTDAALCSALDALPSGVFSADLLTLKDCIERAQPLCRKTEAELLLMLRSIVYETASTVYALLKHERTATQKNSRYLSEVLKAKAYIDENYATKVTLEQLSQITYLSKNFLRVQFEESIGVSPQVYLQSLRLARAEQMLGTTQLSLSEIAIACGYESQSYMSYCFKKQLDISPLQYRKKTACSI